MGLSGLVAQVLLLRELLVSFYGNELTLGIILANWLIIGAFGVYIIGKYIDRAKNKIGVFIILEIVFTLMLPASIYLSRVFKNMLGIPFGEAIGLPAIIFSSLIIIFPVSFCRGGLFSAGCKIYSAEAKDASSIGKVYALEALGTILGGVILTYFFIPFFYTFQIIFFIACINLIACFLIFRFMPKTKSRLVILIVIALVTGLFLSTDLKSIERISLKKEWKGSSLLSYRNSLYGNIVVTRQFEQYTFFYNGIPVITAPYPDKQFVEDFGNLPLLFHPSPKDILVVSAGAGGLINEILKHPVKRVDYAELDPLIIDTLKRFPTKLTEFELKDKRVNIINLDGRFFLRTSVHKYDVVLIGLSNPADLSTNRLFTQEFFSLVKERLNPSGVFAFWLSGSLTYLSSELRDLNYCILNALKAAFTYVRIIPGDYNIFLASNSAQILEVTPSLISKRIVEQNIRSSLLNPDYIDYRLNKRWVDWFSEASRGATKNINRDLRPYAVFEMLKFSNKKLFPVLLKYLGALENINVIWLSAIIFLISFLVFYLSRRRNKAKLILLYNIATTGFFAMLANLILIFAFQVFYGYLYHRIGLLISVFMAGIALGSIFITSRIGKIKNTLNLFSAIEVLIIVFTFILAQTLSRFILFEQNASLIFLALFFICGILTGLEFPLAGKIYLGVKSQVGEASGTLYAADLIGGWLAGIFGAIILLPVLGLFNTCMAIVILKLCSLTLFLAAKRKFSA